jgi:hypothetical protein
MTALTADSIVLVTGRRQGRLALSRLFVERVDVSQGRKIHPGRAVGFPVLGFFVGGVTGGLIAYSTCAPCDYELEGLAPAFGAGIGATVGFVAGLVTGLVWRTDRWEEVPLDRLRVSFVPQRDGQFALGLSVSF